MVTENSECAEPMANVEERLIEIRVLVMECADSGTMWLPTRAATLIRQHLPRLLELMDKQQFYFNQLQGAHNKSCDLRWKFEKRVQELEKKLELTHCHACDWPQCPGITGK